MKKLLFFFLSLCMASSSIFAMDETDSNDNYQSPPTGLNFFLKNEPERVVKYKKTLENTIYSFLPQALSEGRSGLPKLVVDYIGDDINEGDLALDQMNDLRITMLQSMARDGFIPQKTTENLLASVELALNNMQSTKTNTSSAKFKKRHAKRYWVPYATKGLIIVGAPWWLYKK